MCCNWIDAKEYTMDCFLLLDRWVFKWIFADCDGQDWFSFSGRDYRLDMAKALYRYPHVAWYVRQKAPECAAFLDEVQAIPNDGWTEEETREAETAIRTRQSVILSKSAPPFPTMPSMARPHRMGIYRDSATVAAANRMVRTRTGMLFFR